MIRCFHVLAFILCMANGWAFGSEPRTILALGDSITERPDSYRSVLVPMLKEKGLPFEFIGPKRDKVSRHAGYGGKNTAYLRSISKRIYQNYPADIVLLHSGHNSFSKDKPVPGLVRDTEAIIANITDIYPKAIILLARVVPAGKLPKYAYIPELNTALNKSAAKLARKGTTVVIVDQADGFNWKTDTLEDKVHVNSNGAKKMAGKWFDALKALSRTADSSKSPTESSSLLDTLPATEHDALKLADENITYKTYGKKALSLYVFKPKGMKKGDQRPALLFIHGGGWRRGNAAIHAMEAVYFSRRGLVCITINYRLIGSGAVSPADCLTDAKSAMRYIRKHAVDLHVDPDKIITSGGSAGGHLAAALAMIDGYDAKGEDTKISCVPTAMILLYPAFDLVEGWGSGATLCKKAGIDPKAFSPAHRVSSSTPPTLILSGSKDPIAKPKCNLAFVQRMAKKRRTAQFVEYVGRPHKLFERERTNPHFRATIHYMESFLKEQEFLDAVECPPPTIDVKVANR